MEITYTYDDYDLDKATEISKDADVALVFSNADAGEGVDRANLSLWHNGDNLVSIVHVYFIRNSKLIHGCTYALD